ncbi:L-glutamate gamma-semialdehyde dehydrogenase, partial [Odoribacter sp. OttesenSCG-928-G04]|nr:L-glutamate gamma-semialdehyde dehydrogenase [Odoribacter sp. OttesenSCG-928-G04]
MPKGVYKLPNITNEPVKSYAPGSPERKALQAKLKEVKNTVVDIPMIIGGKEIRTGNLKDIRPPHEHKHLLGQYHDGGAEHVQMAIDAALKAKPAWEQMSWESRAAIFLKAADLLAGPYREEMNAVTMLGQSKNAFQAEIDCVCELADFFRFNVKNMYEIYHIQPNSAPGIWNRLVWRPLEGFVFALTPFNFTSIAGNLPGAPALMGNVCVWKPSKTAVYSAHLIMKILKEAGLPDGVINLVYCSGPTAAEVIFPHKEFAGIHFTGSTGVFNDIWSNIVKNLGHYRSYPRIVGETGGKDYIFAHPTACAKQVATAMVRGAFEYQGQKCSAASRAYIPSNIWAEVQEMVKEDLDNIKMGGVEDFTNFVNAVIDESSFDKLARAIDAANASPDAKVIMGGQYDKSEGYFIQPTVILAKTPCYATMLEELFGPVLTVYVYEPNLVDQTLDILDETSGYALTGAI